MAVLLVLLILLITQKSSSLFQNQHHDKLYWSREALNFISNVQNNCSSREYAVVPIGTGGGFAAQFQLAGGEFMSAFAGLRFNVPIVIQGSLNGYSDAPECKDSGNQWTCYFQPSTKCQAQFQSSARIVKPDRYVGFEDPTLIPSQFQHMGVAFWWDVVQYYLFRFQPFVYEHIHEEEKKDLVGYHGFPMGIPVAGIHVRHGDKHVDGFVEHSMDEELKHVRSSPDCVIQNARGDCFIPVSLNVTTQYAADIIEGHKDDSYGVDTLIHAMNRTAHYHSSKTSWEIDPWKLLHQAIQGHTAIIRRRDIESWNHSIDNMRLAVSAEMLFGAYMERFLTKPNKRRLSENSSDIAVPDKSHKASKLLSRREHSYEDRDPAISLSFANSKLISFLDDDYVIPLPIFVASDDPDVIRSAAKKGFLVDSEGVSQHTGQNGMLKTLLSKKDIAFNATNEIISDIHFLSHCSTLVGIAASQIFRMSLAISNATDRLHYVRIMDGNQIGRIKQMSKKYYVPFPEEFQF